MMFGTTAGLPICAWLAHTDALGVETKLFNWIVAHCKPIRF
jgi:hypothetical protein